MLFLLPPSETKAAGGGAINIRQAHLAFGGLDPVRDQVMEAYIKLAGEEKILTAPTMAAINRYTGTLYAAIQGRGLKGTPTANNSLSEDELARARSMVVIQSALFGAIAATDLIPSYKLSPGKSLAGLNLKKLWPEPHNGAVWNRFESDLIIDLRSKAYAELAPLPESLGAYVAAVFVERADGSLEQLNHFNKKAKGQLVRSALTARNEPTTITQLASHAAKVGLRLEVSGQKLTLITNQKT